MLNEAEIEKLLEKLWRINGVDYCVVITDFGENVGYPKSESRRFDLLSSLFEGVFTAEEENGKRVGIGSLEILVADHEKGRIFSKKLKGGILSVIADKKSQMGVIMYMMNIVGEQIDKGNLIARLVKKTSKEQIGDALGLLERYQEELR